LRIEAGTTLAPAGHSLAAKLAENLDWSHMIDRLGSRGGHVGPAFAT